MLPGLEMLSCPNLAVSPQVMEHVVQVESGANPYAIGVVGGRLVRQPNNLEEALATARMLESEGYNFSVGLAQVNRANFRRYGLDSYRKAFNACANLAAGARILARCHDTAKGDWGKAFSCYYSGNFTTGFRDGYVQKVYASISRDAHPRASSAIPLVSDRAATQAASATSVAIAASHAMQPMVVYSGDGPGYRVALRSTPLNGATAFAPLVVSSSHGNAQSESPPSKDGAAGEAAFPAADAHARIASHTGNASSLPLALSRRSSSSGNDRSAAPYVFEPRVRGPRDPAFASTTQAHATATAGAGADLHKEHRDAALVF